MGAILLDEQTAPGTPSMGQVVIYPKSDGELYKKDDTGAEAAMSVSSATDTTEGIVELATQAEVDAGTAGKVPTTALNKIAIGTPVATTSGSSKDFTGLPTGIRRFTVMGDGVSLSGTDNLLLQLGDATTGGFLTSGYRSISGSASGDFTSTAGMTVISGVAASAVDFIMEGVLMDPSTNRWLVRHQANRVGTAANVYGIGIVSLAGALDRIRLTRTGSDSFDAGAVNINYER